MREGSWARAQGGVGMVGLGAAPSSPARVVDPHGVVQQSHGEFAGVGMPGEGADAAAGPAGGRGHREQPGPTSATPDSNSQSHHQNKSQPPLLSEMASSAAFPLPGSFSQSLLTTEPELVKFSAVPPTCPAQHQGTKRPQATGNYSPQHRCAGEAEHSRGVMPSPPSAPRHRSAGVEAAEDGLTQHAALTSRPPGRRQRSCPRWSAAGEGADVGRSVLSGPKAPPTSLCFGPSVALCCPLLPLRPSSAVSPPGTEGTSQCFATHREVWEEGAVQGGEPSARGHNAAQRRLRPLQPCREHRTSAAPTGRGSPGRGQRGAVMWSCRDPPAPLTLLLGADDLLQQPPQPPVPPAAKAKSVRMWGPHALPVPP